MYGKQFIAGLMFLAVAHVRAQDEEEEEVEGEEEVELYEVSPEPDLEEGDKDAAIAVEVPEGEWDVAEIAFVLSEVEEDGAAAEWAEGLPEELAAYAPSDYVLCGVAALEYGEDKLYGLGAQGESQSQGILATSTGGEFWTVYFDGETDYTEEGVLAEIVDPETANEEEGFEPNSGVGDVWGQGYDGEYWYIWSYNGEDGSESWEEGALSVLYVEHDTETGETTGFTAELDLVVYAGAASLIASATTASLLLAMM